MLTDQVNAVIDAWAAFDPLMQQTIVFGLAALVAGWMITKE